MRWGIEMALKVNVVNTFFDRCTSAMTRSPLRLLMNSQNRFDAFVVANLAKVVRRCRAIGLRCKAVGDTSGSKLMQDVSASIIKFALKLSMLALKFAFRRLARTERLSEMERGHG